LGGRIDAGVATGRTAHPDTVSLTVNDHSGGLPIMSILARLTDRGLVKPPRWLPGNVQYETIMGSVAYGVSADTSDIDVYGWAIPPKDDIFLHLRGEVPGFGTPRLRFEQYQEHHVRDNDALAGHGRMYDLTIYGIVKFFNLAFDRVLCDRLWLSNPRTFEKQQFLGRSCRKIDVDSYVHRRIPRVFLGAHQPIHLACGRDRSGRVDWGGYQDLRGIDDRHDTGWRSRGASKALSVFCFGLRHP
jgi:hypothetical protein